MKLVLFTFAVLLTSLNAFAMESGGTTVRCDDVSGNVNGIYISYGYEWINDGSSTQVVDFAGLGTHGKRFEVQTNVPSDSRDFPQGVVAGVSLMDAGGSVQNKVDISYKGDQYEFSLTVLARDIHRDSYKAGGGDDYSASYSFRAQATLKDNGDGQMNPPIVRQMKCRASSSRRGMAG
jgi:hypothetical protein